MKHVQILIFEIGTGCNLGQAHAGRCPNTHPDRWIGTEGRRPLTDDLILRLTIEAYEQHGFRGYIGWHLYCEPLLYWDRIRPLMLHIRQRVPDARFLLWTNGTRLPKPALQLTIFDQVQVTNYGEADLSALAGIFNVGRITSPRWDCRWNTATTPGQTSLGCVKPFSEFIVNAYGQVLLCCYDWRGEASIGNVWDRPFGEIVAAWQAMRDSVAGARMGEDAPARCRRCVMKHDDLSYAFARRIAAESAGYRTTLLAQSITNLLEGQP